MADCSLSDCSGGDGPSYTCNYCGRDHCSDHRMPEKHACPSLAFSERDGKRLENWHDTVEGGSSGGILSGPENTVLGSSDDGEEDSPEAVDSENIQTYGSSPDTPPPASSPDVEPDGSIKDDSIVSTTGSTEETGRARSVLNGLRTLERHFVNLPRYSFLAVRRYGPPLVFLAAIATVGLVMTGHQLPVDLGGIVPSGGGEVAPAGGPAATTSTAAAGAPDSTKTAASSTTAASSPSGPPGLTDDGELNETWLEHRVHQYVNDERRERGLLAMDWNQTVRDAAHFHSRQMIQHDFFAHENPETNGTFEDRYYRVGLRCEVPTGDESYATGGENIAYTYFEEEIRLDNGTTVRYDTPDEVAAGLVASWMTSEGHRENILRDYWQQEGIGIEIEETAEGTRVYATQNFC